MDFLDHRSRCSCHAISEAKSNHALSGRRGPGSTTPTHKAKHRPVPSRKSSAVWTLTLSSPPPFVSMGVRSEQ